MKTLIKTSDLKKLLETQPLVFYIPGTLAGNFIKSKKSKHLQPYNLTVKVFPKYDNQPHQVLVNNKDQYYVFRKTKLSKYWFKSENDYTQFWSAFKEDWKYLLNLEPLNKDIVSTDFLGSYLITDTKKDTKRLKSTLVCIKDIVTKEVMRLTRAEAEKEVKKEHVVYCKKREWRHYKNSLNPKTRIEQKISDYWEQKDVIDHEGNVLSVNNWIPKTVKETPRPRFFEVRNKKVIMVERTKPKKRAYPSHDIHARRQLITILPPVENIRYETDKYGNITEIGDVVEETITFTKYVPKYVYIPIYGRSEHNKHILFKWKKLFVENVEESVTISRPKRTTYKTIITKQYPGELCERRRIIKKNMSLLRNLEKKQKEEQITEKSE